MSVTRAPINFPCFYEYQSQVIDLAAAVRLTPRRLKKKGCRGPERVQRCLLFRSGSLGSGDEGP